MAATINGDGLITLDGTSTTQGRVRLAEDTDNGTNYVELQAPASVAGNVTFTLPGADGTSGQVIQTNGSGTLSFVTPAGGSWVFLSSVTASSAATADIETGIDSTYDNYVVVFSQLQSISGNNHIQVRLKISGSYQAASYTSAGLGFTTGGTLAALANQTDHIRLTQTDVTSNSNYAGGGQFWLFSAANTSIYKPYLWSFGGTGSTSEAQVTTGSGRNTSSTSAVTGIRFLMSTGNISGTFRLYGIKNS